MKKSEVAFTVRLTKEDQWMLTKLSESWGMSRAMVVKQLIRGAAINDNFAPPKVEGKNG